MESPSEKLRSHPSLFDTPPPYIPVTVSGEVTQILYRLLIKYYQK